MLLIATNPSIMAATVVSYGHYAWLGIPIWDSDFWGRESEAEFQISRNSDFFRGKITPKLMAGKIN